MGGDCGDTASRKRLVSLQGQGTLNWIDWFFCSTTSFNFQKTMSGGSCERVIVVLWNFVALYLVLVLCLLTWYSRLYTSWACITDTTDILLMCQFTNQVPSLPLTHTNSLTILCSYPFQIQCYRCEAAYECKTLDQCTSGESEPYHCLTPLYTISPKVSLSTP